MEDYGYKKMYKLPQFSITLNAEKDCLIDLKPKVFKNSDLLSLLYTKTLREYRKPKVKIADRVCIYQCGLSFFSFSIVED